MDKEKAQRAGIRVKEEGMCLGFLVPTGLVGPQTSQGRCDMAMDCGMMGKQVMGSDLGN